MTVKTTTLPRFVPAHLSPYGDEGGRVAGYVVYIVPELSRRTGRIVEWEDWVAILSGAQCDRLDTTDPDVAAWCAAREEAYSGAR